MKTTAHIDEDHIRLLNLLFDKKKEILIRSTSPRLKNPKPQALSLTNTRLHYLLHADDISYLVQLPNYEIICSCGSWVAWFGEALGSFRGYKGGSVCGIMWG